MDQSGRFSEPLDPQDLAFGGHGGREWTKVRISDRLMKNANLHGLASLL
jgi:hypothetical protein